MYNNSKRKFLTDTAIWCVQDLITVENIVAALPAAMPMAGGVERKPATIARTDIHAVQHAHTITVGKAVLFGRCSSTNNISRTKSGSQTHTKAHKIT